MKKILVTGSAGFIGSHLCESLIKKGYKVIGIDNLSNGKENNLKNIIKNDNFEFYKYDLNNELEIEESLKDVSIIFHLAALADIVPSIKNPSLYFKSNVTGTFNLLKKCQDKGINKIIYAASSSCYGIPKKIPTGETSEIMPMYPYALTKRLAEEIIIHFSKLYNMSYVSLRLFNVYGPRARTAGTYGAVFGVFLAQKLANKPYTIVGDGNQTRDFTYISDVTSAFITMMNKNINNKIFNVGSGKANSINYLIKLLGGDKKIKIPERPGEPKTTFADISKITTETNWKPKVSFEKGVKLILDNIEEFINAPVWNIKSIKKETKDWFKYLS
jgi:UDP-glucose 4-epimerase